MTEQYQMMFESYQKGEITLKEWQLFCKTVLDDLMVSNKDVLDRLK